MHFYVSKSERWQLTTILYYVFNVRLLFPIFWSPKRLNLGPIKQYDRGFTGKWNAGDDGLESAISWTCPGDLQPVSGHLLNSTDRYCARNANQAWANLVQYHSKLNCPLGISLEWDLLEKNFITMRIFLYLLFLLIRCDI